MKIFIFLFNVIFAFIGAYSMRSAYIAGDYTFLVFGLTFYFLLSVFFITDILSDIRDELKTANQKQ